jgi:hypothetical protein
VKSRSLAGARRSTGTALAAATARHACPSDSLEHRPDRFRPADDVRVQVLHFLMADRAGVDDQAEAVRAALFGRQRLAMASIRPRTGRSASVVPSPAT